MKTIGLLGGTSWPSTVLYYEYLNRAVQTKLGGFHSARILLYSMDYQEIKSHYHAGWDQIPALLAKEINYFLEKKPDCLILCNNTLHRAFDEIKDSLRIQIPVFHAGHLAAVAATRDGHKKVLLLGTAFTMEDGFFANYFHQKNIEVVVPNEQDRKTIQSIQSVVAQGTVDPQHEEILKIVLANYIHVDAIILACTELPLVINERNSPKPLINTIHCQCEAAVEFALKAP